MKTISVIIPTYNNGEYLTEAISSILSQTKTVDEIIIVDDGSTDNTSEIISKLKEPKIRYFKQNNSGVSEARNNGIRHATGDYIAFLDADDRWRPKMIEMQAQTLDCHPEIIMCFTNFIRFVEPTGAYLSEQFSFYPELSKCQLLPSTIEGVFLIQNDAFCELINFGELPGFTPATMFRKAAITGIEFNPELKICEDAAFILRIAATGKVAINKNVLLEVRRHNRNTTNDISLMAVHKLKAIFSLTKVKNLNSKQKIALQRRIARAHFLASSATAKNQQPLSSIKYFVHGLYIRLFYLKILTFISIVQINNNS